jgi:hypothetical protein
MHFLYMYFFYLCRLSLTNEVMARVETKTWVKALDRRALEAFVESVGAGGKKINKN